MPRGQGSTLYLKPRDQGTPKDSKPFKVIDTQLVVKIELVQIKLPTKNYISRESWVLIC